MSCSAAPGAWVYISAAGHLYERCAYERNGNGKRNPMRRNSKPLRVALVGSAIVVGEPQLPQHQNNVVSVNNRFPPNVHSAFTRDLIACVKQSLTKPSQANEVRLSDDGTIVELRFTNKAICLTQSTSQQFRPHDPPALKPSVRSLRSAKFAPNKSLCVPTSKTTEPGTLDRRISSHWLRASSREFSEYACIFTTRMKRAPVVRNIWLTAGQRRRVVQFAYSYMST